MKNLALFWLEYFLWWYTVIYRWALAFRNDAAWATEATADVLHEVFRTLKKDPMKGQEILDFRSWLYKVAHRVFLRRVKKEKKHREHEVQVGQETLESIKDASAEGLSEEDHNYLRAILYTAIEDLNDQQRKVLTYFYWDKMHIWEIAEEMKISAAQVSRLKYNALQTLQLNPIVAKVWHELYVNE